MRRDNQGLHTITIFQLMCKGLNSSFLSKQRICSWRGDGIPLSSDPPISSHPTPPLRSPTSPSQPHNSYSRTTTGNPEIYYQLPWRGGVPWPSHSSTRATWPNMNEVRAWEISGPVPEERRSEGPFLTSRHSHLGEKQTQWSLQQSVNMRSDG